MVTKFIYSEPSTTPYTLTAKDYIVFSLMKCGEVNNKRLKVDVSENIGFSADFAFVFVTLPLISHRLPIKSDMNEPDFTLFFYNYQLIGH